MIGAEGRLDNRKGPILRRIGLFKKDEIRFPNSLSGASTQQDAYFGPMRPWLGFGYLYHIYAMGPAMLQPISGRTRALLS